MSNIVKAIFTGTRTKTRSIYQYDYGMVFKPVGINLPDVYEVHFSNYEYTDKAKPQLGNADGCLIPDEYLQTGKDVWAFIYLHKGNSDGETEFKAHIPVIARPEIDPAEPTPVQQGIIEQAIATLNTAVQQTAQDVTDANEYAQAAEQAKDDAVFAKQGAEDAQDAAEDAQEAAEAASRAAGESSLSAGESANRAESEADRAMSAVTHNPIIRNNNWYVWDSENEEYIDSGAVAIGQDGISPYVEVTPVDNGYQIAITDAQGTHTFIVHNGQDGGGAVQDVQVNGTSILEDGVANIPLMGAARVGVAKVKNAGGTAFDYGDNSIIIYKAGDSIVKAGTNIYMPIVPQNQHLSIFYGLAKAAGDTTQSQSNNAVGSYTETARGKIHDMLDAPVEVSGQTPTITAVNGVRYKCGTLLSLSIDPPTSGDCEVIFTSGTTPTTLTVPNTVKFPEWFDPTALETETVYDIIITDAQLGMVGTWA